MLTFYLVVTAFLAGIAASHRPDDLMYVLHYGSQEERIAYLATISATLAFIVLWPVWMVLGLGFLISKWGNQFKRL